MRKFPVSLIAVLVVLLPVSLRAADPVELKWLGTHKTGIFNKSAAEFPAYAPSSRRLYVVNAAAAQVDILDISVPARPVKTGLLDLRAFGKEVTSVATHADKVFVCVAGVPKHEPGQLVIFDAAGTMLDSVQVGAGPDMVAITPDGRYALVANEGEPDEAYRHDPEGSISVIDLFTMQVRTAGFSGFLRNDLPAGMRLAHPSASVAQDVEPEYITISRDSKKAWVVLQENNAVAEIGIQEGKVLRLWGLGFKDHSKNRLDASNRDGGSHLAKWPVRGMYQPDAIASYQVDRETYLVTANEGDARDYEGYSEEKRIGNVTLDPQAFPDAEVLQAKKNLGRLKISAYSSDTDGDGDMDTLYAFGARSFSIWNTAGDQIFDSGWEMEKITSKRLGENFNADNDENGSGDSRSDDKGPEPEGIAIGVIGDRTYAFIGLERVGGIMIYDISVPSAARFVGYTNNRDFQGIAKEGSAGDLGPEGLVFIPASSSPSGKPLLAVTYEVSGTTSIFEVVVH